MPARVTEDAARDAACRRLATMALRYPDVGPPGEGDDEAGGAGGGEREGVLTDARDAAFAHAIVDAAVRRWTTIAHLVQRATEQSWDGLQPSLRAALLCGGAQLIGLDRVPTHAAVDHSVEWAKRAIRPGAARLANALLRRLASLVRDERDALRRRERFEGRDDELAMPDGSALGLAEAALPESALARLAVATGMPEELLASWAASLGIERARGLAAAALAPAPTIVRAPGATGDRGSAGFPGTLAALVGAGFDASMLAPHARAGFAVFHGPGAELGRVLARPEARGVWVQDPASAGAVESLRTLKGFSPRRIADVCAGRGTKTRQLLELFPEAEILASDPDPQRRATLEAVFADQPRVRVVTSKPGPRTLEFAGTVDLLLLDVPCTNTGVLSRRPEARHRFSAETVQQLVDVQRQIVADNLALLRPGSRGRGRADGGGGGGRGSGGGGGGDGGAILFATCSLDRRENQEQTAWARKWHQVRVEAERLEVPSGAEHRPGAAPPEDAPARHHDGAYSVLWRW